MSRIRSGDWEMINQANHGDSGSDAMISELLMLREKILSIPGIDTRDCNFEVRSHSRSQGIGNLQTAN